MSTRFTAEDYDEAIRRLHEGKKQLEPDGNCCSICGDGCAAFECRFNPLVAMKYCEILGRDAKAIHDDLHELERRMGEAAGILDEEVVGSFSRIHQGLHWLCGIHQVMSQWTGPGGIVTPEAERKASESLGEREPKPPPS